MQIEILFLARCEHQTIMRHLYVSVVERMIETLMTDLREDFNRKNPGSDLFSIEYFPVLAD